MQVILSPQFIRQFEAHIEWIAVRSPKGAERVGARIRAALRLLPDHPEIGRTGRVPGTRELTVTRTRFLLIYRLTDEGILVSTLLHGSQLWPR